MGGAQAGIRPCPRCPRAQPPCPPHSAFLSCSDPRGVSSLGSGCTSRQPAPHPSWVLAQLSRDEVVSWGCASRCSGLPGGQRPRVALRGLRHILGCPVGGGTLRGGGRPGPWDSALTALCLSSVPSCRTCCPCPGIPPRGPATITSRTLPTSACSRRFPSSCRQSQAPSAQCHPGPDPTLPHSRPLSPRAPLSPTPALAAWSLARSPGTRAADCIYRLLSVFAWEASPPGP